MKRNVPLVLTVGLALLLLSALGLEVARPRATAEAATSRGTLYYSPNRTRRQVLSGNLGEKAVVRYPAMREREV
jgi:hypothetical protein